MRGHNKFIILLPLILIISDFGFAASCRCKESHQDGSQMTRKSCRYIKAGPVENAASTKLWFRSIPIESFMVLMADLGEVRLCISETAVGKIGVKISSETPWPEIVEGVANHYGLKATINSEEILIMGTHK